MISHPLARGRRRAILVLAALLCAATTAALSVGAHGPAAATTARATYRNPVFARDFPDPNVLRVGGDYYAYGTTTGWQALDHLFPILHSRDLVHWRYIGDAMSSSPAWGVGDWWAPDVIQHGRAFYMYYVGKSLDSSLHCIAVATSSSPSGPFTPRRVIGCADKAGRGYIDPAPFVDSDGKAYLYVSVDGPYHNISVIPLTRDLMHAAGPRKELFALSQDWETGPSFATVEGPFMLKRGHAYDLFYSGNDWQHNYAMGYAISSSPLGPFKKYRHNPILRGNAHVTGPGGGSVVQGSDGGWWLVYHAWTGGPGYDAGGVRNLRIDPLTWSGATIGVRGPTLGAEPAPLPRVSASG